MSGTPSVLKLLWQVCAYAEEAATTAKAKPATSPLIMLSPC